jgi:hypothetical protein
MEGFDFDAGELLGGERTLRFLDFALEFTHSAEVLGDICTRLTLVLLGKIFNDTVIKIFTTKVGVTSSGQNLEDTIVDREGGNIKSTTTEIVDDDPGFATLLVKTVGDSGSSGLIDDTKNFETGDGTSILGGLTLGVVEVCKNESLDCRMNRMAGSTYRQGQ